MDAQKGHNYTSCSGALQCDVMWVMCRDPTCKKQIAATVHVSKGHAARLELHAKGVFAQRGYHKMVPCTACTIKTSQTLLQVQEDDQSSLPMSQVASLDTVPVICCVPLQEKIDKWARNRRTCQGSNRWVVNPECHELEKCAHTHTSLLSLLSRLSLLSTLSTLSLFCLLSLLTLSTLSTLLSVLCSLVSAVSSLPSLLFSPLPPPLPSPPSAPLLCSTLLSLLSSALLCSALLCSVVHCSPSLPPCLSRYSCQAVFTRMDGWMAGWVGECVRAWVGGWVGGCMHTGMRL